MTANSNILTCFICGQTGHHSLMVMQIYQGKDDKVERAICQKCSGTGIHTRKKKKRVKRANKKWRAKT